MSRDVVPGLLESRAMNVASTRGGGRPIVVVLGMHRSGTSLLSHILHYIGCDMADGTDVATPKNPGGFWERPALTRIQDEILTAIERPISDAVHALPFPPGWWRRKEVQALKGRLVDYVADALAGTDMLWGFKDPRTCRLLPLWTEIFRTLDLAPVYLHALRSPEPSARSMAAQIVKPRPVSAAISETMWLAYTYDTIRYTLDQDMLVVDYDDWFADPQATIARVSDHLPLAERLPRAMLDEIADEIVAPGFRNEHDSPAGQRRRTIAKMFYDRLRPPAGPGPVDPGIRGHLPFIDLMFRSMTPVVEKLDELPEIAAELAELERRRAEIATLAGEVARLEDALASARADAIAAAEQAEAARQATAMPADPTREALRDRLRILDLQAALDAMRGTTEAVPPPLKIDPPHDPATAIVRLDALLADAAPSAIDGAAHGEADGIVGHALRSDAPERPLVVAAQVDGRVVAETVTGVDGRFHMPWAAFPRATAGTTVRLAVTGTDHVLPGAILLPDLSVDQPREGAADDEYGRWILKHQAFGPDDRAAAIAAYRDRLADRPLVSMLLVDRIADPAAIARSIASLVVQVHDRWELLIPDPGFAIDATDPRVRVIAARDMATLAAAADGSVASFLGAGDMLTPDALLALASAPPADLVYADEDRITPRGRRSDPLFKGAWSLDRMLAQDYAVRPALVATDRLRAEAAGAADMAGAYGSILRIVLAAADPVVRHVPHLLYHRAGPDSDSAALDEARRAALATHRPDIPPAAPGDPRIRWPLPSPLPKISLIVPTRDRLDLLQPCIDGFLHRTAWPDLEILIVDNDSRDPATLDYLAQVGEDDRVTVLHWSGAFDYSAINNFAAERATGTILGLMNNDLKVIEPKWLGELARHVVRPDVGIVGARLLYGDGTLQHAGVAIGIGTASHLYKGFPRDHAGHGGVLRGAHDVSAVTAACLLIRREVWDAVGGLSTAFPVAYNDIDLCLAVRKAGYRILLEPRATLFHLESQSRGLDDVGEKKARLAADRDRLVAKWGAALADDPFYNPNLTAHGVDAGLADPPRTTRSWLAAARDGRWPA